MGEQFVKRITRGIGCACLVLVVALLVGACGDDGETASSGGGGGDAAQLETVKSGSLTVCADMQLPPIEFYKDGKVPTGSEVEMGQEIAKDLGLKYEIEQVQFNGIIPALLSKRCDFIAAGLYPTPERGEQINFVNKSQDGQGLLVKKGNPEGIQDFDATLGGKRLGMISGYATIDGVKQECADIGKQGAEPCKIVLYGDAAANIAALRTGKVDAAVDSITAVSWYSQLNPNDFEYVKNAGVFLQSKVAFGVRKDDAELQRALQENVDRLYENGYMCKNLAKWDITAAALPPNKC